MRSAESVASEPEQNLDGPQIRGDSRPCRRRHSNPSDLPSHHLMLSGPPDLLQPDASQAASARTILPGWPGDPTPVHGGATGRDTPAPDATAFVDAGVHVRAAWHACCS